jgi:hypothetical protein
MKRRQSLIGVVVVLAVVTVVVLSRPGSQQPAETDAGVVPQSGMVTHIDPVTGKPTTTPAGTDLPGLGDATNQSNEGLVEEDSPVPGGGKMADLQGRFQNTAVVTADSDSVHVQCVPEGGER